MKDDTDFDISTTVGAVTRKLDKVERNGKPAWRLTATRIYATDVDDAWNALTDPERIPRWFLPVSGELEVGGRYQFEGNAGGEISECEPPRRVAVTWEMHDDVSWVTVTLSPHGEGTRFELEHVAHVPAQFFDEYGPGAVGVGWDLALMALGLHFDTGEALDPKQAEAWTTSAEGRPYVVHASDAWVRASIDAGVLADQAKAAGVNTVAFYTGEAPPS